MIFCGTILEHSKRYYVFDETQILACKNILERLDETYLHVRTSPKMSYDTLKICPRNFIDETGHWVPKYICGMVQWKICIQVATLMFCRIHTGEHR